MDFNVKTWWPNLVAAYSTDNRSTSLLSGLQWPSLSGDLPMQTPKIACNINTHLEGLENSLRDSIRQISLVNIFPQATQILASGIFPPRSLTQQYDWLTKITWDVVHAIPQVGP